MKKTHLCPKCGSPQVLEIREVAETEMESSNVGYSQTITCARLARYPREVLDGEVFNYPVSQGDLEAWSCRRCGFTELYVKTPSSMTVDNDSVRLHSTGYVQTLQAKVDSLELALSSLMELLQVRAGITAEEISLMMQRLDLADGVEDGRIGPDATRDAPRCANCGRPVNPNRESCLFCNAPLNRAELATQTAPTRTIVCSACGATVAESDSYFGDNGLVCSRCFSG